MKEAYNMDYTLQLYGKICQAGAAPMAEQATAIFPRHEVYGAF